MIIFLVEDKKLTLEGAKLQLSQKKESLIKQQELVERLKVMRSELIAIAKEID
jgi:hypothetical protein